jgi:hypothetical protein
MCYLVKKLLRSVFAVATAGFSRLSTLLILTLGSKFMSPKEFGIFTILFIIAGMISAVVSGGGDMWLNKFTRYDRAIHNKGSIINRYYLRTSLLLGLFFIPIAGLFIFTAASFFGFSGKVLGLAIIYGVIAGLNETLFAIIRSTNRVGIFFLLRDFLCPVFLIGILFFNSIGSTVYFFMISSLLFGGLSIIILGFLLLKAKYYLPKSSKKLNNFSIYMYTFSLISNNLSSRLLLGLDSLMLTFFMPITLIGYYRLCSQFAGGFNVVQHFSYLALPWHFHKTSDGQSSKKGSMEIKTQYKALVMCSLASLILLTGGSGLILDFFGMQAFQLKIPFILFLIIRFAEILWGPMHEKLISNGKITDEMLANIGGIFAWLFVFFIAINFLTPIYASVWAVAASSLAGQYIRYMVLKSYGLNLPLRE